MTRIRCLSKEQLAHIVWGFFIGALIILNYPVGALIALFIFSVYEILQYFKKIDWPIQEFLELAYGYLIGFVFTLFLLWV